MAKYFKLFTASGLEKSAQSHDFRMIISNNTIFTYKYTTITFPEFEDANLLNIQSDTKKRERLKNPIKIEEIKKKN